MLFGERAKERRGFGRMGALVLSRALRKYVYACLHLLYVFIYASVNL